MADDNKKVERSCFVVGPIGKPGTETHKLAGMLLNAVIKPALETKDLRYKVKRADEDADPGMINDRVIQDIVKSDLVVADLSELNPNAFYELGIRHATQRSAIHIARNGTALPFDNAWYRAIFVDVGDWASIQVAVGHLRSAAEAIDRPDYKISNPLTQANASFAMKNSEDPRDQIISAMSERLSQIQNQVDRLDTGSISGVNNKLWNSINVSTESGLIIDLIEREISSLSLKDLSPEDIVGNLRSIFGSKVSFNLSEKGNKSTVHYSTMDGGRGFFKLN